MDVRAVFTEARGYFERVEGDRLRRLLGSLPPLVAVQIACMVIHTAIPSGPALHFSSLLDDQEDDDEA